MNTDKQFLVLIGAPLEEQQVVGPFACFDDADQWCQDTLKNGEYTWIITLISPTKFAED